MYDKKEFPIFVGTKLKKCMIESERQQIIELIKKEVIPAIGCTEPIAVALCVAKAAETSYCRCFGCIDRSVSLSTGGVERLYSGSGGTG